MTIHFNPHYDSSVFLTAGDCALGVQYVGREGLLSELELRAGLTIREADTTDRVISYMDAMRAAADEAHRAGDTLYFEDSFSRDDFGTAALMLRWRDSLVKLGWAGNPIGTSRKIEGLSKIEKHFSCPGLADRWRSVLDEAARRPILRPDDRIVVECSRNDLEPVLERLFDAVGSHYGTPVVEYHTVAASGSDERGVPARILSFDNEYDAHEWIASQKLTDADVVAEADRSILSDMLHTMGRPGIGASDEGIGAVMMMMPLGMSLFRYPADISRLQPYLQSPRNPLSKLHTEVTDAKGTKHYIRVTRKLLDHICSNGGFGKEWADILEGAVYDDKGARLPDEDIASARSFTDMWERSRALPEGEAPVKDVREYLTGLSAWALDHVALDKDFSSQFQAMRRHCASMVRLLDGCGTATVAVDRLSRWATHVCEPIDIGGDYARLGSMNVIGSVGDIYSSPERLIWYAASTDNTVPYEYDFLSRREIADLDASGIPVPDKELTARLDKAYRKEGLARCGEITVVTCERVSGTETVPCAILSEFTSAPYNIPVIAWPDSFARTAKGKVDTDLGKRDVHRFDPSILKGFSRRCESYSSINTLLQSPVDYLLDYFKRYTQYGIEEIADVPTTEGTVAHAYIEALGDRCAFKPKDMLEMHRKDFDSLLDEVITEKGVILFLEENRLEEKSFRVGLRESIETLLDIIISNGLEIYGHFEYPLTVNIPPIGDIYAKIDCLLRDPSDGKFVIFDFKWNGGSTYERKIRENRELQLAVYRKVVETALGEVKFIGYYAFPRKTLYTPLNTLGAHEAIMTVPQDGNPDIFKMACDGYEYRWSQLRKGELEEAEGMALAGLDYFKNPALYPLDGDYENANVKACAYGGKNIVLKGGLE